MYGESIKLLYRAAHNHTHTQTWMVYARTVHRRQQMIPNLWVTLSGVISLLDPYFFISFPYLNFYGRKFLHLFLRFLSLFSRCFTWLSMYGQIQNIHQFGNKMHAHCAPNQPTNHPMIIFSFFSTLHEHKFWIFDSYFGFNFHWCIDILRVCVCSGRPLLILNRTDV